MSPWSYAGVFAIYAVVMFSLGDSDKYGSVTEALAWLIFLGVAAKNFSAISTQLSSLTGANLNSTPFTASPPIQTPYGGTQRTTAGYIPGL